MNIKSITCAAAACAALACAAVPEPKGVPELMKTSKGEKVITVEQWEKVRAPELLALFEREEYGRRPAAANERGRVSFDVYDVSEALDGKAVRKLVCVTYKGPNGTFSFPFTAYIPKTKKPVPAFVHAANIKRGILDEKQGLSTVFWPVGDIIARGYATAAFRFDFVAADKKGAGFSQGIFPAVQPESARDDESWGTLSAWAWANSRILDWMETEPLIDAKHVGVVGHSRGGKTAILTAVLDRRFAMACSNNSGCSGAKLNHIDLPKSEHIKQILKNFPYWFCKNYQKYAGKEMTMDFDQHELLALLAPRLLCVASATEDAWAGQRGEWWAAKLASPAWELYGKKGLVADAYPAPEKPQQEGCISYHIRKGPHFLAPYDWHRYMDFADRHGWRTTGSAIILGAVPMEIAVRGEAPAYTIVVPEKASPVEKYAAEELQGFMEKVTGVKLPIASDDAPLPKKAILLGETKHSLALLGGGFDPKTLGSDGFRLAARPPHLVAYGSAKRGALYAAYEILETYAGCRWYSSWHSVIPKKDRVAVPGDLDDVQTPAFAMRQPFWYDVNKHRDLAARLRVNGYNCTGGDVDAKFGGDDFRFGGGLGNCHTFNALLPPSAYFDKHPEYFSLVKGKRLNGRTQLCLTNPDVLRIVTSNVLERIRKDPGAKFYGVSQNDWYNYCECEKCAAIDKEEESHAGTMVRFVNAVAEAVEKEFPDAVIETLAYQYTRKPPKKTRLRHNVVPCLCTIECDFARPMNESPYAENISFRRDIEAWKTQTDQLYLWDYVTEFQNFTLPFPNILSLQDNVRFFRDNNVKELFAEGAQLGRHGAFAELKAWLLAKWMWNPELPAEPLLKDFLEGYYGKAAPFIRKYLDELHRRQREWSADPSHPLRIWRSASLRALDDGFVEWARPLWRDAVDAVKDDPALSYNVRMSEFSFDFLRLERMRSKWLFKEVAFAPCDDERSRAMEAVALTKSLLARMDEAKDISLSESRARHNSLIAEWKTLVASATNTTVNAIASQCAEMEESRLKLVKPGKWGEFMDDPKAGDGKALKLFNTHFEWCAIYSMGRVKFRPGAKYRIRARVRVEKARDGGEVFWAGVYDPVAKKGLGGVQPRTDAIKNSEYVWYDVCTWTPRADGKEYFWIGPGRFGTDGKSSIKAIYIDKIEISSDK